MKISVVLRRVARVNLDPLYYFPRAPREIGFGSKEMSGREPEQIVHRKWKRHYSLLALFHPSLPLVGYRRAPFAVTRANIPLRNHEYEPA